MTLLNRVDMVMDAYMHNRVWVCELDSKSFQARACKDGSGR
jgi:hypothetical protein